MAPVTQVEPFFGAHHVLDRVATVELNDALADPLVDLGHQCVALEHGAALGTVRRVGNLELELAA